MTTFAIASRDELWLRRRADGVAADAWRGDAARRSRSRRVTRAMTARARVRVRHRCGARDRASLRDARVRVVVRATRENDVEPVETTMTIAIDGVSVVTTPSNALADYELLHRARNGSGAVARSDRLAEWIGARCCCTRRSAMPANTMRAPVAWPAWLSIDAPLVPPARDVSRRSAAAHDASHRAQNDAPFALPDERIEVQLVAGGAYDPITDVVTIDVAVSSAGPFTIRRIARRDRRIDRRRVRRTDSLSRRDLFARRAGVVCRFACAGDDHGWTAMTLSEMGTRGSV